MNRRNRHPVTLTKFTETGAALAQLNAQGYVDIAAALHLIAEGLAEPEHFYVRMDNFPRKRFEGVSLSLEGSLAAHKLEQQLTPVAGLSDTRQFTTGPELADSRRVVTGDYLKRLGKDGLSQLDRRFAGGWCPDMPLQVTEVIDIPLPRIKTTSRRKTALKLAGKIGPVDPRFDHKAFMDKMWDETEPDRTEGP